VIPHTTLCCVAHIVQPARFPRRDRCYGACLLFCPHARPGSPGSVAYFEQRLREEHPWLRNQQSDGQADKRTGAQADWKKWTSDEKAGDQSAAFLLEIGTEELPAADVADAIDQLRTLLPRLLEAERLDYRQSTVSVMVHRVVWLCG